MRKRLVISIFTLMSVLVSAQEARLVERTFVTTDKSVYVAGDDVWCSAFCIDVTDGGCLSTFSSVCYVELISTAGPVANCKLALENGRGAGHFRIPVNAPTGNYRLVAYTAVNRNEVGMDYFRAAPVISVYNTLSTARTEEVVLGKSASQAAETVAGEGSDSGSSESPIRLQRLPDGKILLQNNGAETASVSLSVYCDDCIPAPQSDGIEDFVDSYAGGFQPKGFTKDRIPEYDGEIITMHVPAKFAGTSGFISSPGKKSNIYTADVEEGGVLTFFTGNIYGETNMVFQLDAEDAGEDYEFEVETPFVTPQVSASDVPALCLCEDYSEDLLRRSLAMQISDKFGTKLLTEYLPERADLLFSSKDLVSYKLEDYTRFQTFREVFVEYVKEAMVRRGRICVVVNDVIMYNSLQPTVSNSVLVLIDGVPVLDHELALGIDPALVRSLDIYPHKVAVGSRVYGAVVNFVTLREDMAGVKLPESSRMLDFNGVCYPVALTGERIDSNYPDYRQTLLWQPLLKLEPGETIELNCVLPAYEGEFRASVVGMTCSGKPLSSSMKL